MASASSGTVTGTVTEPDGITPVGWSSVYIHDQYWSTYQYVYTGSDGTFSLSVPSGTYTMEVYGYSNEYSDPDPFSVTVVGNETTDLGAVEMLAHNVFGKITEPDGITAVAGVWVNVHSANWTINKSGYTDSDGLWSLALQTTGTYTVEMSSNNEDYSPPSSFTINYTSGQTKYYDGTNGSEVLRMQAPAMRGVIENISGDPLDGAYLNLHDANWNWQTSRWGTSDPEGAFKLDAVPTGSYLLDIDPPWVQGGAMYVRPDPIPVSLTNGTTDTTYETSPIVLERAKKTITGTVRRSDTNAAIANAEVSAYNVSGYGYAYATTGSNGTYTMTVGTGTWEIWVYAPWVEGVGQEWAYTGAPKRVKFEEANSIAESSTASFGVTPFNATLTGKLLNPDGSVPSYANVNVWGANVGNWDDVDEDGRFSMKLPAGTFNVSVWSGDQEYGPPTLSAITLGDSETINLGTIHFIERNASVSGTVRDSSGVALENQYVDCWKTNGNDWANGMTDADGEYTVYLTAGPWMCTAYPQWGWAEEGTTYVATDEPVSIVLKENQDVTGRDFTFAIADATISGTVRDEDGSVLPIYGWVDVRKASSQNRDGEYWYSGLGASIDNGAFKIKVPAGNWTFDAWIPSDYTPEAPESIAIDSGETVTDIVITALPNTATIQGAFVDADGQTIDDLAWADVYANNGAGGNQWANASSGEYEMNVSRGTWNMGYWIDEYSTDQYFAQPLSNTSVTVADDETVTYNIPLLTADSTISGYVLDPDGNPLPNVLVKASTSLGSRQSESFDMYGAWFGRRNISDDLGRFQIKVPQGAMYLTAYLPISYGYINPDTVLVNASPDQPVTGVVLQFQEPNATIEGTVAVSTSADDEDSGILVWARNSSGHFTTTYAGSDGSYSLGVVASPEPYYVGAADDSGTTYFRTESDTAITVDQPGTYGLDLSLYETSDTLGASVNTTYESSNARTVTIPDDDFSLQFPAYSTDSEGGTVNVTIEQTGENPSTPDDAPASVGYDISARDSTNMPVTDLNSDATICIDYDPDTVDPEDLTPKYWDETTDSYQLVKSYVINTENNTVCFTTDHLTKFILTVPPSVADDIPDVPETPVDDPGSDPDDPDVSLGSPHRIVTTPQEGGPQVRVFNDDGSVYASFFAYSPALRGTFTTDTGDIDGDGVDEIVVSTGAGFPVHIRVFEQNGTLVGQFFPYDTDYRLGATVQLGDLDGNGASDIVVAPLNGTSNVRAYSYNATDEDFDLVDWFWAYGEDYRNGVTLKLGDLTGNGRVEIITATRNSAPNVRVFQYDPSTAGIELLDWFWAFDENYRGLLDVRTGDVTGDGRTDLVLWPQGEQSPNVRVYTYSGSTGTFDLVDWFWAYGEGSRASFSLSLADIDGDNMKEIITAPLTNGGPNVRIFQYDSTAAAFDLVDWFWAYDPMFRSGVTVATGDTDGDGAAEIITTPATAGGPNVRLYSYDATTGTIELSDWTFALNEGFRGPLSVKLTDLTGDSGNEILVAPRGDGGPNVRMLNTNAGTLELLDWFWAYDETFTGGVQLNAASR